MSRKRKSSPPVDTSSTSGGHSTVVATTIATIVATIVAAVVGAVIGGVYSYRGAKEGVKGSVEVQRAEHDRLLNDAAREDHKRVYPKLLTAASEYWIATDKTTKLYDQCLKGKQSRCIDIVYQPAFLEPRNRFQTAVNDVYVYGTDRANRAAEVLSNTLPRGGPKSIVVDGFRLGTGANDRYSPAYKAFLNVMCDELSAKERTCPQ